MFQLYKQQLIIDMMMQLIYQLKQRAILTKKENKVKKNFFFSNIMITDKVD